jgi:RNA polymerase sigma factor (sigma-70 family)
MVEADLAEQHAERARLWAELSGLPRQQRVVLALRYYEALTDTEIAGVLGCSAGTVRGYASRALATLRARLELQDAAARGGDVDTGGVAHGRP